MLRLQASDAFQSAYNDALVSGELEEMDAAGIQEWGNEQIQLLGEPLGEYPDLREQFEAGQRAKLTPLIAGKVDEARKQSQAEMLGTIVTREADAKEEISELLRVAAAADTPDGVRMAAFDAIQVHHDEYLLTLEGLSPEKKAQVEADFNDWQRDEQFQAVVMRHAHEGTLLELSGRLRNRTDWVDLDAKEGARWSEGMEADRIEEIMRTGWSQESRILRAKEGRRSAAIALAKDHRANVATQITDDVLSGQLSLEDGRRMMREQGWIGGKHSEQSLLNAFTSYQDAVEEATDRDLATTQHLDEAIDDRVAMLASQSEMEIRASISGMRRLWRNGIFSKDQRDAFIAEAEGLIQQRQLEEAEGTERQKAMWRSVRQHDKAFKLRHGYREGFVVSMLEEQKDDQEDLKARALQVSANVQDWLARNDATEDQVQSAYAMADAVMSAVEVAWNPTDGLEVEKLRSGAFLHTEQEEVQEPQQPSGLTRLFGAFDFMSDNDDPAAARSGSHDARPDPLTGQGGSPAPDLRAALESAVAGKDRIDTHREFFGLMPIPAARPYLRYDNEGGLDAAATLDAMEASPSLSHYQAAMLYTRTIAPLAEVAESVKGWRSGLDRAKDEESWMKAKGLL